MFLSKEICKVEGESIRFLRVEMPGITINRKLDPGLNPDCPVHSEKAGAEKHLPHLTAWDVKILPLKDSGSLAHAKSIMGPALRHMLFTRLPASDDVTIETLGEQKLGACRIQKLLRSAKRLMLFAKPPSAHPSKPDRRIAPIYQRAFPNEWPERSQK